MDIWNWCISYELCESCLASSQTDLYDVVLWIYSESVLNLWCISLNLFSNWSYDVVLPALKLLESILNLFHIYFYFFGDKKGEKRQPERQETLLCDNSSKTQLVDRDRTWVVGTPNRNPTTGPLPRWLIVFVGYVWYHVVLRQWSINVIYIMILCILTINIASVSSM